MNAERAKYNLADGRVGVLDACANPPGGLAAASSESGAPVVCGGFGFGGGCGGVRSAVDARADGGGVRNRAALDARSVLFRGGVDRLVRARLFWGGAIVAGVDGDGASVIVRGAELYLLAEF